jgi:hypothetical protein
MVDVYGALFCGSRACQFCAIRCPLSRIASMS